MLVVSCKAQSQGNYSSTNKKAIKLYEKASEFYQNKQSAKALDELSKCLKTDSLFAEAHALMGYIFIDMKKDNEAIKSLSKAVYISPNFYRKLFFTLGRLEMTKGMYAEAKMHLSQYLKSPKLDPFYANYAQLDILNCDFAIQAMKNPVAFNPKNMGAEVNTDGYEYFPAITADNSQFMFTRNVRPDKNDPNSHWQEDFFISKNVDGKWTAAKGISNNINTQANEGAPTLSVDGQILFFVICAQEEGYGGERKGYGSCDIFYSQLIGTKWTKPQNVGSPVNSKNWETQPSFSSDGKTLYFIRGTLNEEGVRDRDIWMAQIQDDGRWSNPVRLSDKINTPGNEESVYIHPDNQTLYFASNGHIGMGGMDIFMCKRDANGEWGNPINLGYPINTWNDENSLLVNAQGNVAYFSSDRAGGFGGMDIYYFELDKSLQPQKVTYVKGKVFDKETKAPLEARFELIDLATGKQVIVSGSNPGTGEFLVCLPPNKDYMLNVSKEGYLFYSQNFSLKEQVGDKPYQLDVPLSKPNVDEIVRLDNVFFDTDKFDLKPESKAELNKLVDFLKKNAALKIELRGHTDSDGNDKSNLVLSDNRAKAVYQYLIDNGITKERLSFKGYGETLPIEKNDTPEGRQKNRRTEFKIIAK
jgi:outer membrane protein OmpA-like peptidoglycan-associated protein/tetratricopeptide (TPR) repeat protein